MGGKHAIIDIESTSGYVYFSDSCDLGTSVIMIYAVGYCYNNKNLKSVMFTLESGQIMRAHFTSLNCVNNDYSNYMNLNNCAGSVGQYGYINYIPGLINENFYNAFSGAIAVGYVDNACSGTIISVLFTPLNQCTGGSLPSADIIQATYDGTRVEFIEYNDPICTDKAFTIYPDVPTNVCSLGYELMYYYYEGVQSYLFLSVINFETPAPTLLPTFKPTFLPTFVPTYVPTHLPTSVPTTLPTFIPSSAPTNVPTSAPTHTPTAAPTSAPTFVPTNVPTVEPTLAPTSAPTSLPTVAPTSNPTVVPTFSPTFVPTCFPTHHPTVVPTPQPSAVPTLKTFAPVPTARPTTSAIGYVYSSSSCTVGQSFASVVAVGPCLVYKDETGSEDYSLNGQGNIVVSKYNNPYCNSFVAPIQTIIAPNECSATGYFKYVAGSIDSSFYLHAGVVVEAYGGDGCVGDIQSVLFSPLNTCTKATEVADNKLYILASVSIDGTSVTVDRFNDTLCAVNEGYLYSNLELNSCTNDNGYIYFYYYVASNVRAYIYNYPTYNPTSKPTFPPTFVPTNHPTFQPNLIQLFGQLLSQLLCQLLDQR